MSRAWIAATFWASAVYDGVLGIVFFLAPEWAFEASGVTPPNHFGYVQFPAALLVVFAAMFVRIARDPMAGRVLIPYGIGLKVSYCAVVFWYWATRGLPWIWKPFAISDLVFTALFAVAWVALGTGSSRRP